MNNKIAISSLLLNVVLITSVSVILLTAPHNSNRKNFREGYNNHNRNQSVNKGCFSMRLVRGDKGLAEFKKGHTIEFKKAMTTEKLDIDRLKDIMGEMHDRKSAIVLNKLSNMSLEERKDFVENQGQFRKNKNNRSDKKSGNQRQEIR
ncbi:MAG: hypothetical protein JJV93_02395 [Alphaproteobacteria bacterium]|nr:hypothetical protein [Alphaproteobacteria bacterium]